MGELNKTNHYVQLVNEVYYLRKLLNEKKMAEKLRQKLKSIELVI